jgi:glycosyltransferase involved in cell wall biosynthesis
VSAASILVLTPGLGDGGGERAALRMAAALVRAGHDARLVALTGRDDLLDRVSPEVPVRVLGARRALGSVPALARLLRQERPAAVIAHQMRAARAGLAARALARSDARFVTIEHSLARRQLASLPPGLRAAARLALGRMYRRADAVVALTDCGAREFEGRLRLPPGSAWVVPNIVLGDGGTRPGAGLGGHAAAGRPGRARPRPLEGGGTAAGAEPLRLLYLGRLVPEKGVDTLLRAAAFLRERRPVRLRVAGGGPDRARLEALAAELGLAEAAEFLGPRDDVPELLARAQLLVLASREEALPTVLVEALAAGARVVAADVPCGPREILEGGRWGTLVPPADPEALAAGIERELAMDRSADGLEAHLARYTARAVLPRIEALAGVAGSGDRGLARPGDARVSGSLAGSALTGRSVLLFAPFGPPHGGWSHVACATRDLLRRRGARVLTVQSLVTRRPRGNDPRLVKGARAAAGLDRLRRSLRVPGLDAAFLCVGAHGSFVRDLAAAGMVRRAGLPVVVRVFGTGLDEAIAALPGSLRTRALRLLGEAAAVLVETASHAGRLRALGARRVLLVPNFVPEARVAGRLHPAGRAPDGLLRIVYAGRLDPVKGVGEAVEAVRSLPPAVPWRLDVVGPAWHGGPSPEALEREARGACGASGGRGPSGEVVVHGPLEPAAVYSLLARSDVLVCPTRHVEGQPAVVVEAMAHGVVPIVPPIEGVAGLVEDGETGLVVEAGHPAALSAAIERLAADRARTERLGRAAAARVRETCSEAVAARVLSEALA